MCKLSKLSEIHLAIMLGFAISREGFNAEVISLDIAPENLLECFNERYVNWSSPEEMAEHLLSVEEFVDLMEQAVDFVSDPSWMAEEL